MSFLNFTSVLLGNLVHGPVTTKYPAVPAKYPERTRGHIQISIDDCIGCGMCVRSCPTGCLSVDKKAGTWTINRFDCIACGACAQKCPKKCLEVVPGYQTPGGEKFSKTYQKSPEQLAKEAAEAAERAKKIAAAKAAAAAKKKAAAEAAAKAQSEAPAAKPAAAAPEKAQEKKD